MGTLSDTKELYSALGPLRFFTALGGVLTLCVGFVLTEIWLSAELNWPEAFGFQCQSRRCLLAKMAHSGQLLKVGGAYAWSLFALYWALPAVTIFAVIVARFRRKRRNPILPME